MCEPTTIAVLTTAAAVAGGVSAYQSADMNQQQAEYQSGVAANNAIIAGYEREAAIERGEQAVQDVYRKRAQIRGAQEAGIAGNGLDLTAGTPADILFATDYFGEMDARTTQGNAMRQAWGADVERLNQLSSSSMYGATAKAYNPAMAAGLSLLGSSGNVADKWVNR